MTPGSVGIRAPGPNRTTARRLGFQVPCSVISSAGGRSSGPPEQYRKFSRVASLLGSFVNLCRGAVLYWEPKKKDPTVDDINLHYLQDPKLWELWYIPYYG